MKKFISIAICFLITLTCVLVAGLVFMNNSSIDEIIYSTQTYSIQNNISDTDIIIEYPFFIDNDGRPITKLNEIIYDKAVKAYLESHETKKGLNFGGKFSIKLLDNKYVSILVENYSYVNKSAYPTSDAFGITYNLQKKELVDLSEVTKLSNIDKIVKEKNFKIVKSVNDFLTDPVFENYMNVDSSEGYYITEDSIGLIFWLPHVAGDYTLVETPIN